jgi:hypothetical protein
MAKVKKGKSDFPAEATKEIAGRFTSIRVSFGRTCGGWRI